MTVVEKLNVLDRRVERQVLQRLSGSQIPDPDEPGEIGGGDLRPVPADPEVLDRTLLPGQAGGRLPCPGGAGDDSVRFGPSYAEPSLRGEAPGKQAYAQPPD